MIKKHILIFCYLPKEEVCAIHYHLCHSQKEHLEVKNVDPMTSNYYVHIFNFSTLYMNMIALCILGIAVSLAVIPTFDKILWTAE